MCGIVGYVGKDEALPVLIDGLRRLEYRGYDSAGVAVLGEEIRVTRSVGNVAALETKLVGSSMPGTVGIGHTRWATHGVPSEENAHPHSDCTGCVAVVHNGIVENDRELRAELVAEGHAFRSETDSETLAHLLERELRAPGMELAEAVRRALRRARGAIGLVVAWSGDRRGIVAARAGCPIVVGVGEGEMLVASDAGALSSRARRAVFLEDGDVCAITRDGFRVATADGRPAAREPKGIVGVFKDAGRDGYAHYMRKEICEQPDVLRRAMRGRLRVELGTASFGEIDVDADRLRSIDRMVFVGCGSAHYAGQIGGMLVEEYAGIPAGAQLASEFSARPFHVTARTAVIAVSQSGETADTLAAVREARRRGALTVAVVNAEESTLAREADAVIYVRAGTEIGVASTKAFSSQAIVLAELALFLGRQCGLSAQEGRRFANDLGRIPSQVETLLAREEAYAALAAKYAKMAGCYYLGRGFGAPVALEGALKLKEIALVHAEGYAAGEMKHGPIALVDRSFPSVVVCPVDGNDARNRSTMRELRARGGPVIAVTTEGNDEARSLADDVVFVPRTSDALASVLAVIPLQLFAYHLAVARGLDPDRPRNLAKSVTVE